MPSRVARQAARRLLPVKPRCAPGSAKYDWFVSQPYVIFLAQEEAAKFLATFKEFPPSQRAQSFTVDQIIEKMQKDLESVSK